MALLIKNANRVKKARHLATPGFRVHQLGTDRNVHPTFENYFFAFFGSVAFASSIAA